MALFINEAINLFVGDNGPDNSKHLVLESIKLPTLEETTQNYTPGGGIGEIKVSGFGLKPLESTFKIKGFDPQIMKEFGIGTRGRMPFTVYGAIRDKKGNKAVELRVVMEGRIVKLDGNDLQRAELADHDHAIDEIWHYECYWDKKELYYYDFLTSDWRVDGVSQNSDIRNILRIPGAA